MEGYLEKWSRKTKEFRRCYVVILKQQKYLLYYDNDAVPIDPPRGKLPLENAIISVDESEGTTFSIINDKKYIRFRASDIPNRNLWALKISELCATQEAQGFDQFLQTRDCIEFMQDAHNKLSTSMQSLNINDLEIGDHINKFSLKLSEIKSSIDELKCLTDSEHNLSELDEDTESLDVFQECESIGHIPGVDQDNVSSSILVSDYAVESEIESDEIGSHSSIIFHLASQLKLGMDLSKITLPTYILERRSLLEMFSDFFSRPQILLDAISKDDPKDRFLTVVKHYIGSFYPGRRSKVSKKPYNPILGECFKCFYQCMPNRTQYSENVSGPVRWAKTCDLSFIAEQVSHHPPISAFYAECPSAKFSCNAFIYTKSKFLGTSVAVENIGKGVIALHKYNEEYEFNFPSGYARSIFTVPWFELGGMCYINCKSTGYSAQIEFLTKGFIRGKKHQISGNFFEQSSKKPFATINGDWKGHIHIRFRDDGNEKIFMDSLNEPINRKYVKPLSDQEPNESRVVWQHVSRALKQKDIDAASEEKSKVEEHQRTLAASRPKNTQPVVITLINEVL